MFAEALEKALQAALTDAGGDVGRASTAQSGDDDGDRLESARPVRDRNAGTGPTGDFDAMDDDIPF